MSKKWKLKVQGVKIISETPEIIVRDALIEAGFDPNDGWIAILKTKCDPRRVVQLSDVIDLTDPGVEKLRLRPNEINNGEATKSLHREFCLLEKDEIFLKHRDQKWETVTEASRSWLVLRSFPVPKGYNHNLVDIAVDIPPTYPAAQIDMFYCHPHLTLENGTQPLQTEARVSLEQKEYQQWSRHLNGATRWNPTTDSVISHIALIEEALLREVPIQ